MIERRTMPCYAITARTLTACACVTFWYALLHRRVLAVPYRRYYLYSLYLPSLAEVPAATWNTGVDCCCRAPALYRHLHYFFLLLAAPAPARTQIQHHLPLCFAVRVRASARVADRYAGEGGGGGAGAAFRAARGRQHPFILCLYAVLRVVLLRRYFDGIAYALRRRRWRCLCRIGLARWRSPPRSDALRGVTALRRRLAGAAATHSSNGARYLHHIHGAPRA